LETEELMYLRNLLSWGGFESSSSCEEERDLLPEEMVSRYDRTVGERFWRVVGSEGEAIGTVIGADIVGI
jgi:hypothetical protein